MVIKKPLQNSKINFFFVIQLFSYLESQTIYGTHDKIK